MRMPCGHFRDFFEYCGLGSATGFTDMILAIWEVSVGSLLILQMRHLSADFLAHGGFALVFSSHPRVSPWHPATVPVTVAPSPWWLPLTSTPAFLPAILNILLPSSVTCSGLERFEHIL